MNPLASLLLVALAAAACTKTSALYCEQSSDCEDPARPYCDVDGVFPASDGIGKTCIADPFPDAGVTDCVASTTACVGDILVECDDDGAPRSTTDCALGCFAEEQRCYELEPSNGLGPSMEVAKTGPDVVLSDGAVIDTTNGTITDGDGAAVLVPSELVAAPEGGVAIRVFSMKSLILGDTRVIGEPALALVVAGDVLVDGRLRLDRTEITLDSGAASWSTPGMFLDGCGEEGEFTANGVTGGGGGGFGSPGGRGGFRGQTPGGAGGGVQGETTLVPLRGGCFGSAGGGILQCSPGPCDVHRGAGGGALQVSAGRIEVAAAASVEAPGFGDVFLTGGGAGGGLLLEAGAVELGAGAVLAANGGGGGCTSIAGADGLSSTEQAQGATCSSADGPSEAGDGASSSGGASDGAIVAAGSAREAPGGGGGTGRIRVNSRTNVSLPASAIVSPAPSVGQPIRR